MPLGWCERCKKAIIYDPDEDGPYLCGLCKEEWEEFHMAHAKEIEEDKMRATMKVNERNETKMMDDAPVEVETVDTAVPDISPVQENIQNDVWPTASIHVSKEIWEKIAAPKHYVGGRKYEPSKVAFDWDLDSNCGSALKYISRLGRKEGAAFEEDLCKAIRFLMLELEAIQEHKQ